MNKIPTDPDEILALLTDLSTALRDGFDAGSRVVKGYWDGLSKEKGRPIEINRPAATGLVVSQFEFDG